MEQKEEEIIFTYYGKEYSVIPEKRQYIFSEIKERENDEGEKEKYRAKNKYFSKLESFLKYLRKIELSNSQNETLEDMAKSIFEFNKWAKNKFKVLK